MKKEKLRQEHIDALTKKATVIESRCKWEKLLGESPRAYARGITCFGLCPPEFSLLNSGILHPPANAGGFK